MTFKLYYTDDTSEIICSLTTLRNKLGLSYDETRLAYRPGVHTFNNVKVITLGK